MDILLFLKDWSIVFIPVLSIISFFLLLKFRQDSTENEIKEIKVNTKEIKTKFDTLKNSLNIKISNHDTRITLLENILDRTEKILDRLESYNRIEKG